MDLRVQETIGCARSNLGTENMVVNYDHYLFWGQGEK